MRILEVNFDENKNGLKTIGFHRFSWNLRFLSKSEVQEHEICLPESPTVSLLYIIRTKRLERLYESPIPAYDFFCNA